MTVEEQLRRRLDEALPLRRDDDRDWDDVLERAGVRQFRPRQLLLLAAVVVLLGVPSAYAVGPRLAAYFGGSDSPAPATVETSAGTFVLGAASSCWSSDAPGARSATVCALGAEPRCGDAQTPSIPVARGERVRFAFDFEPTTVRLSSLRGSEGGDVTLPARRATPWIVDRSGVVVLQAAGRDGATTGSAAYVACLVPR